MKKPRVEPDGGDGEMTTSEGILHEHMEQHPPIGAAPLALGGMDLVIDGSGRILPGPLTADLAETGPITAQADWPAEVREANADPKNRFAHFILVAQVGCGGSGTVHRAWDARSKRYAGLKILHSMEPMALERFTRESRIASSLRHPAIATTYEVGEHAGRSYIAMRYIDGRPIDAEPRSIPLNLGLIRDACRALDYAHGQGIIHRDIKPANLLVDRQGHLFVTDFGVARKIDHDHTTSLSVTGSILGTPKYLPPEQARGEAKRADARSDVYSLGATLYKLLSGRPPFSSGNVWETIESVMKKDPPLLTSLNRQVSPELERLVARAMAKNPANRFASAGEMADALERLLVERRYSGRYGLPLHLARKWGPVAAGAVALALVIAWVVPALLPGASAAEATDSNATHYKRAATALLRIEESEDMNDPARRSQRIRTYIDADIAVLQSRMPGFLHAKVLKLRASYLDGARGTVRQELAALSAAETLDYRIGYLRALIDLEEALARPLPLPAPEAPMADWWGNPPDWRRFQQAMHDVLRAGVDKDSLLFAEHRRDAEAVQAFQPLVDGDWPAAYEKLKTLTQTQRMPVYLKARRAAAYLARRFDEVRAEPGAQLALAIESENSPEEDLKRLGPLVEEHPSGRLLLTAWTARRLVKRGIDPGKVVAEGLALVKPEDAAAQEFRGILEIALLRWRGLSGRDDEPEFAAARERLGKTPATWMGRLAEAEALLGIGRRRKLRGGDARKAFDEAIACADSLQRAAGWNAPLLIRGEAHLGLGRYEEAIGEVKGVQGSPVDVGRAQLIGSAACLRLADEARRAGSAQEAGFLKESAGFADRVLARSSDHPEALTLRAAGAIFAAETAADRSGLLKGAVDQLSLAIERIPEFVEASFHRACALFLLADGLPSRDPESLERKAAAVRDLDRVLAAVPTLAAARALRGILRCSMGEPAKALEDLRAALNQGTIPDPEELKEWIRVAEAAKER